MNDIPEEKLEKLKFGSGRGKDGKPLPQAFKKGNLAQSTSRAGFVALFTDLIKSTDLKDPSQRTHLQKVLMNMAAVACDPTNKNCVKAAELILDRCFGQAAKAPEDYEAMKSGLNPIGIQVVIVPPAQQAQHQAVMVNPLPKIPSPHTVKLLQDKFENGDE